MGAKRRSNSLFYENQPGDDPSLHDSSENMGMSYLYKFIALGFCLQQLRGEMVISSSVGFSVASWMGLAAAFEAWSSDQDPQSNCRFELRDSLITATKDRSSI